MINILKAILAILFLTLIIILHEVAGIEVGIGMAITFMIVAFISLTVGLSQTE